jgi:hypothetical protein
MSSMTVFAGLASDPPFYYTCTVSRTKEKFHKRNNVKISLLQDFRAIVSLFEDSPQGTYRREMNYRECICPTEYCTVHIG